MFRVDHHDTITAISTPIGESGIGIVRLSGKRALEIADRIFISRCGKPASSFKTYTTHYGWIIKNAESRKPSEYIDEVILTVMRAPRSYTKEDIVEINCHGGVVTLRKILELTLEQDCRLASPGEFTKRAFLNGRIDLAQAEAVLDIIRAKTDSALRVGTEQLKGALSHEINKIRRELLDVLTVLEAGIDFPEEDTGPGDRKEIANKLERAMKKLEKWLAGSRQGRVLREGIHVVICGKPNVGKSSLLNALLKQERSIVTSVPGTTRDTIEEIIDIKGIPVRIVDTAGIIEPRDLVEKKAILRSKKYMRAADLILLVFDGSRRLSQEDRLLMNRLQGKQVIAIINKVDLKQRLRQEDRIQKLWPMVKMSAKKRRNIHLLEDEILRLVQEGKVDNPEPIIVSHLRHVEALRKAQKHIAGAILSLDNKLPNEFTAQDIKEALDQLDGILGKKFSEDLLDKIFREFCIGK